MLSKRSSFQRIDADRLLIHLPLSFPIQLKPLALFGGLDRPFRLVARLGLGDSERAIHLPALMARVASTYVTGQASSSETTPIVATISYLEEPFPERFRFLTAACFSRFDVGTVCDHYGLLLPDATVVAEESYQERHSAWNPLLVFSPAFFRAPPAPSPGAPWAPTAPRGSRRRFPGPGEPRGNSSKT